MFLRKELRIMKNYLIIAFLLSTSSFLHAQNPKFDKLEMNFAQGHYKRVYRKANRLLDKPEYDFSMIPTYYKSISLFELSQNKFWLLKHPDALKEAETLFLEVKNSEDGQKIFNAHMYEISWLRSDLVSWAGDLKRMGYQESFEDVQRIIDVIFDEVPEVDAGNTANDLTLTPNEVIERPEDASYRDEIILTAKQFIGTPYVWAGNSPEGFDCSGFTAYVMDKNGKELPRRASDQYELANKVKAKNVQKGDLVFFNNGSGISHVGIVISEKGEPLTMIHSSSSKGIIITEVEKSDYWMKRLHGFGTFVH